MWGPPLIRSYLYERQAPSASKHRSHDHHQPAHRQRPAGTVSNSAEPTIIDVLYDDTKHDRPAHESLELQGLLRHLI